MAAIAIADLTKYPCHTQDENEPSFGPAPASNFRGTTGDNAPDEPDDLVLGFGQIIPRWDVKQTGSRKLQYYVKVDGFPSADQAKLAASTFQAAADSWAEMGTGVSFAETDQANANFYLAYQVNPASGPGRNTLARAFFPHEVDQDVIVFSRAFDRDSKPILKNIFQHEIGHIMGLRHEFAITGDADKDLSPEGQGAVQFLELNYNSIMSYNFPPKIQDSDIAQVAKFYQLPNGYKIGDSPITDYMPRVRTTRNH